MAISKFKSVDEYISSFPKEVQEILQKIRRTIKDAVPETEEKISYQMPTFILHGILVHFAAFRHHIGFYPTPSGIDAFSEELAAYKSSKGSVQFPLNKPIPYDLIGNIAQYRATENLQKLKQKI